MPNEREAFLTEVGEQGKASVVLPRRQFIEARRKGKAFRPEGHYGPLEHDVVARGLHPVLSQSRDDAQPRCGPKRSVTKASQR